ncbi:NUDIX hydrolase [Paraburkholderia sp. EG287A]|uniref:NUDIX hydrolase n=1 Tax=Paraburkholderia sp. EG287A TaxID=3237012 RepID=UPI0034D30FA2
MKTHVVKTYTADRANPICLHENRFFRMMFNGDFHYLDSVKYPRAVVTVPRFSNGDLLLVKLTRAPAIGLSWEFPRGGMEEGESAVQGAKREFHEETGYQVHLQQVRQLGRLAPDSATINSVHDVVLIDIPDDAVQGAFDTREITSTLRVPEDEFRHHILCGDIVDGLTIGAYGLLLLHLTR